MQQNRGHLISNPNFSFKEPIASITKKKEKRKINFKPGTPKETRGRQTTFKKKTTPNKIYAQNENKKKTEHKKKNSKFFLIVFIQ